MTGSRSEPRRVRSMSIDVDGISIAYREAGLVSAPTVVLLHGFPGSSATFQSLINYLTPYRRVIAPDYPGFGASGDPDLASRPYTFDQLATTMGRFLNQVAPQRFSLYMFDFGGPVGMRIAGEDPRRIQGLIFQNANIYESGLGPGFNGLRAYWSDPGTIRPKLRQALLSPEGIRGQHLAGASGPDRFTGAPWELAAAELESEIRKDFVLDLLADYEHNLIRYPEWQRLLREHNWPVAAVWGVNDPIFTSEGATALTDDVPTALIDLLDAGHFAAGERPEKVADTVLRAV